MEIKPPDISFFRTILSNFIDDSSIQKVSLTGSGHIHQTWLVETSFGQDRNFILQKINHKVFPDINLLMNNIYEVTNFILRAGNSEENFVPEVIETKEGKLYYKTQRGEYWRLYRHIPESKSYDLVPGKNAAFEAGKAYGRFIRILSDFPANELKPVIKDFHSLEQRYSQFNEALRLSGRERFESAEKEIQFAHTCYKKLIVLEELAKKGQFPVRVTHNDTKINNVLFDRYDKAISVIDLDTVMPGLLLHDFGDAIRTAAALAAEDEEDLMKVDLDMGIFEAFSGGFLSSLHQIITQEELKYLPLSVTYITFIMGLRFLTDFLNKDVYFTVHKENHNLVRAKAQFRLAERSDEKTGEMSSIIQRLYRQTQTI